LPDNTAAAPFPNQRIYFRIPAKLPAEILISGRLYKKVHIEDLSIGGLGFSVKDDVALPELFEMRLRLPGHLRPIRMKLEARYKGEVDGQKRIGCLFADLAKKDEDTISNFIVRFAEFSLPCRMLSMASFLLFIDALCRRFGYMIDTYYVELETGGGRAVGPLYGLVLAVYTLAAFFACIYIDNTKKKRFLFGFICAVGAFLFVLSKNIIYLRHDLWQIDHLFVTIFLYVQVALLAYAGVAIALYSSSIKKISSITDSVESYRLARRQLQAEKPDGGPA